MAWPLGVNWVGLVRGVKVDSVAWMVPVGCARQRGMTSSMPGVSKSVCSWLAARISELGTENCAAMRSRVSSGWTKYTVRSQFWYRTFVLVDCAEGVGRGAAFTGMVAGEPGWESGNSHTLNRNTIAITPAATIRVAKIARSDRLDVFTERMVAS